MQSVHGVENAEGPARANALVRGIVAHCHRRFEAERVESTKEEETGRQGWMGSNNRMRGSGGARETWRRPWTGTDERATEGPTEPEENTKRLRKLIFLSRITG